MELVRLNKSIWLLVVVFFSTCSRSIELSDCQSDLAIDVGFESCLIFKHGGNLDHLEETIETIIRNSLISINEHLLIEDLIIIVEGPENGVIREIGIGGFNPNKREVFLRINPQFSSIVSSLEQNLSPLLAHEVHHAARRRTIGYGTTLLETMISEGMADCFAMEVTDINPPQWSKALTGAEIETWLDNSKPLWNNSAYDHNSWFFGTSEEIPRWTGYSLGFHLIKEYLQNFPDQQASTLVGASADAFIPE